MKTIDAISKEKVLASVTELRATHDEIGRKIARYEQAERQGITVLEGGRRPKRPCCVCGKDLMSMRRRQTVELPKGSVVMNIKHCHQHAECSSDESKLICSDCVKRIVACHAAQKD